MGSRDPDMTKINTIIESCDFSSFWATSIIYLSRDMSMFDEYGVPGERFGLGLAILFILLGIFNG